MGAVLMTLVCCKLCEDEKSEFTELASLIISFLKMWRLASVVILKTVLD